MIALLGTFGWGTFAAALVPTVAIGFNWKRASATAANTAMIAALLIIFGVELCVKYLGFSSGTIALIISLTLFFGISLFSKPPVLDPDIEAVMDL